MDQLKQLLIQIEQLRKHLNDLHKNKDFTDPEVIVASQMLDAVLNEYYRLMQNKSRNDSN